MQMIKTSDDLQNATSATSWLLKHQSDYVGRLCFGIVQMQYYTFYMKKYKWLKK